MVRAAEIMTESDDYDGGEYAPVSSPASSRPAAPDNGMAGLSDLPRGTDSRPAPRRDTEPQFEVVETDSEFRPIDDRGGSGRDEGQATHGDREDFLAEDTGDGTLLGNRWRGRETTAQRNKRQRQARERSQAENARLKAEVDSLRARVEGFEPRLSEFDASRVQQQLSDFDRQIQEQAQAAQVARARISEAMIAQDGEALGKALDARDAAIMAGNQLQVRKNLLATGNPMGDARAAPPQPRHQVEQQTSAPARLPTEVRQRVDEFAETHPWYTPNDTGLDNQPRDMDTRITLQIDSAVAADGFDPRTQDYWDEVEDRMRRYLPHRFERQAGARPAAQGRQQNAPQQRMAPPEQRGPRIGGGSDRAPTQNNDNRVYLSPERKSALQLAGVLDRDGRTVLDPGKFARTMKSYQEYDRANGVGRQ